MEQLNIFMGGNFTLSIKYNETLYSVFNLMKHRLKK